MNWVLDADIRGFFDAMSHSWILRFLEHRIADKRILRLIAKWLKEVGDSVARNPKNLGQWLSRSLTEEGIYYLISDWVDEPSFREFEKSDAHRVHREQLNPYRSGKSMVPMQVVAQRADDGAALDHPHIAGGGFTQVVAPEHDGL